MSTSPVDISCERLAIKVAQDILGMTGRDRGLESIRVKLSPFDGVAVEHTIVIDKAWTEKIPKAS